MLFISTLARAKKEKKVKSKRPLFESMMFFGAKVGERHHAKNKIYILGMILQ